MKPSLLTKVMLFLASISPCGVTFEDLSKIKLPESASAARQIVTESQTKLGLDADLFAFSRLLTESKDATGSIGELDLEQLEDLPGTLATCCELTVAALAAQHGRREEFAKVFATEAQRRLIALDPKDNPDLLIVRELSRVLFEYFKSVGDSEAQQKMIGLEAQITLTKFITSPHLVGATIVKLADFMNATKPEDQKSADFYQKVILDLKYIADDPTKFPHAESYEALYWLKRSYQSVHKITGDEEAKTNAEKLDALLRKEKVDESNYEEPRYGLLAKIYCGEPHFIALVIKHAQTASMPLEKQATMRHVGHLFGCSTSDVEYYRLGLETKTSAEILEGVGIGKRTLNGRDAKDISEAIKILERVGDSK